MPPDDRRLEHFSVKEAVMPFGRFPGADTVLGPEMKSTGEVMGIARNFPAAFAKTQLAISYALPEGGTVFVSAPSCPSLATSRVWAFASWPQAARPARCGRPAWSASR